MVAMAPDNVIPFPDGGRGPAAGSDRGRTLAESRDLVAQKLREVLRALVPALEEDLLSRGDVADEREQRNFYYGAREAVHEHAVRLEGLLAAHWLRTFDDAAQRREPATRPGAAIEELELVDFGDMDEELAIKAIAGRLRDGCEDGLYAAGRRLAYLAGSEGDGVRIDEILSRALRGTFVDAGFAAALRLELLRWLAQRAVADFAAVVHDLNAFLVGRNVLPGLRRSFARPTTGKAPARNGQDSDALDIFALLQRLVTAPAAGFGGGPGGGVAAGGGIGIGGGATSGGGHRNGASASVVMAMEQVMASLDALQRAIPPPTAQFAGNANVLREFRTSATGQSLDHLDAITVDIVATLFDFIFDDDAIADPIKALVGRLQIPVLKVAMLDKSFFSSRAHPARRLLDGISRAAVRCGPRAGHEDPLYAHVSGIIERLQAEFTQDTALFDELCGELDAFLDGQETVADERAARAAPLVEAQERRELAGVAADQALAGWLVLPLPTAVTDLLDNEWRELLVRRYLAGDDEGWGMAVGTVSDLVASVQPQADVRGRKLLAAKLPTLVKRIHDSLDSLQVAAERRLAVIDSLFSLHAAVLRGATPVVTTNWPVAPQSAEPEITRERLDNGDTQLESISLVDAAPAPAGDAHMQVAELRRGDWVEFVHRDNGGPVRYRLSWISPQRGILLFTNPQSPRALSVAPAALAVQIERGEATIVPVEPIFERAVHRALEALQAA